mmetsp:Transcript_11388/g.13048  ORF Transcript_11388/g.13048 Transcript_11388/m.13048 type:complete len:139 (-) Transcript_11388:238-654(-)|eukprot:CAMPEP_0184021208 /NCGR_PEP_ID=MMETSP0954-20121128/9789_1 /TAXON_ID=627963 /ORGANISM="Aplanochytrium sp, Strain PBS07" /LENGTH=138 /DNA_ID=CAMNT_0026303179 /DNA_START=179 /DNA_END=595 /DNA_ORIENTATION=+
MQLHNFFIVNKAGGLIYNRSFSSKAKLNGNDYLVLASTFHSLHSIASQVSPVKPHGGIESMEVDTFTLSCFQTQTGLKFFITADRNAPALPQFLRRVYQLYADYVLKNPFYELDQVVRCSLFDTKLQLLSQKYTEGYK